MYRQVLHWFEVEDPAAYAPGRFPVFIWIHGAGEHDYFYGFPALPGAATVKLATEQYAGAVNPDAVDRTVHPAEAAAMFADHIAGRLRGVTAANGMPVANSASLSSRRAETRRRRSLR